MGMAFALKDRKALEDEQSDDTTDEKQQYRVGLLYLCKVESTDEQRYTYSESKWIVMRRTEVLLVHQQDGCSCYQTDDGRTKPRKDILHNLGILMGYQIAADENHDDEWKPHDGKRSQDRTQPRCPDGIALMQTGGITHVGGAVDADRTRSRLADSHNIRKLSIGEPVVLHHRLVVDERKHRISTTKIKCTNLGKYAK